MKASGLDEAIEVSKELRGYTFIIFCSDNCGYCNGIEFIIKDIAERFSDSNVFRVDAHIECGLADKYSVENVPTVIIYKNQDLVDFIVGLQTPDRYLRKLQ